MWVFCVKVLCDGNCVGFCVWGNIGAMRVTAAHVCNILALCFVNGVACSPRVHLYV